MKHIHLLTFVALLAPVFLYGQSSLSESRRSSYELLIYKLNEQEVRSLYLRERGLDESMLHTFILSCPERKDIPPLPRGNYISVRVVENKLEYSDYTVDNLLYNVVEDEKVMLHITDTLGNVIKDAEVKRGRKRLKFDKTTQTYNTSRVRNEKIVEVNNRGVLHYIEFLKRNHDNKRGFFRNGRRKIKNTFNRVFAPDKTPVRKVYDGFVVFSKPKYKPGETVRFKAYVNDNGRPYNEEAEVSLSTYFPVKIDTVLTTLKPYRPGMYEWEFVLSDSLKLRLDNNYDVVIKTKRSRTNNIKGSFRYEEYELGRITFEAKTEKEKYVKGDTVKLRFSVRDDNNMPVYDGRVNITVRPSGYPERKYFSNSIFIPDQMWRYSLDMTGRATDEIILPDSIFVDGAAMRYNIACSFTDSGNEVHQTDLSVYMNRRDRLIDFSVNKGVLTIRELTGGKSVPVKALINAYNVESEIVRRDSVMLPYSMPLLWIATDYEVETGTAHGNFDIHDIPDEIIGYRFFREKGKVRLIVDNPAEFPFWYTIRKGKNIIDKGYTTKLDYSHADRGKNGYVVQLSYLLGDRARTMQSGLPYGEKNITMEVKTPTTVYPGQTVPVNVTVKDKRGRPVKNADITSYAFTSKFGMSSPDVTIFGKSRTGKRFQNIACNTYDEGPSEAISPMDWNLWRRRMGLDSIEYYKFLYPDAYYSHSEKVLGDVTQISPYIVIDGELQGVHILYIDEQPHYFHQAQQLNVYSFPVTPGYHTLKFRTHDREIVAEDIYVEDGAKTTVSLNGEQSAVYSVGNAGARPVRVTVTTYDKKDKGVLSDREVQTLREYMITMDNTFRTATPSNEYQQMNIPAMIDAGGVYYYINHTVNRQYDFQIRSYTIDPVLVGPFPYRGFSTAGKNIGTLYVDTVFVGNFEIEGGNRYTIWNDYSKQQSWERLPFSKNIESFIPSPSFTQNALTPEAIRTYFYRRILKETEQRRWIMVPPTVADTGGCRLELDLGYFADGKTVVQPLMIRLSREEQDSTECFYYGATRDFNKLSKGKYRIDLIFSDSTEFSFCADLLQNGLNYMRLDSVTPEPAGRISRRAFDTLNSLLRVSLPSNPLSNYNVHAAQDGIVNVPAQSIGRFDSANYTGKIITGTVRNGSGNPLVGVTVIIEGTRIGATTDMNGKFTLPDKGSGNLFLAYLGFKPLTTKLISGYDYKITLEEVPMSLSDNNVVVIGYGTTMRSELTGSVSVASSITGDAPPLIIVDGVPYDGVLSDLNPDSIASLEVLKNASTAIYGSHAANGVIFIETKGYASMTAAARQKEDEFPDDWSNANSLRTNFHDDAFWRPALSTGRDGTITFDVTYPDDITSWNANFIAVGGRKQTGKSQLRIKSFKPLNAQLSLPQFIIRGDSLNAIGRLTNHTGDTVRIVRSINTGNNTSEERITLATSHIDPIPVTINDPDSVKITYSLAMENGYFDGERRTIPVYKQGILETHGEFVVLNDTAAYRFVADPALGKVTVHAEASAIQSFLNEIDRIDKYPYLCNEQVASKIKVLLSKKKIYLMLGKDFKEGEKIKNLIKRLEKNQNSDYLWGWWNRDKTEFWISKQIIEAMLDAEAAGYKVNFNKQTVLYTPIRELNRCLSSLNNDIAANNHPEKSELLHLLGLLKKLDAKMDYAQYFQLVSSLPDGTLNDRLRCMEMMSVLDVGEKPQTDTLLSLASETMMGSLYWREKENPKAQPRNLPLPNMSDIENTLTAYRILQKTGGNNENLNRVRNYFFEMRRSGSWPNTYESSRILETIVPDILTSEEGGVTDAVLIINGQGFTQFPVTVEFDPSEEIDVKKTGTVPLFFTAYQQAWNESPDRVSQGFSVRTAFYEEGDHEVSVLQAGKNTDLKVSVSADSDAEYVMIEVPIPAGCSYESKSRGNHRQETHREYFKEKVSIFCNKLSKGDHEFIIPLIPRYSGLCHVNPAKIELMYYPAYFGRDGMKEYRISDLN